MMGPADDGALPPDVQEQVLRARRPLPAAPCARAAPGAGAQRQRPPPPPRRATAAALCADPPRAARCADAAGRSERTRARGAHGARLPGRCRAARAVSPAPLRARARAEALRRCGAEVVRRRGAQLSSGSDAGGPIPRGAVCQERRAAGGGDAHPHSLPRCARASARARACSHQDGACSR